MFTVAEDISTRIVDLRKNALGGLTQSALAVRAGVGKQQVSNWETGTQRPARTRLETWANREHWPLEIFTEGGPMPSDALLEGRHAPTRVSEDNTEVSYMTFLAQADRALRDTLRQLDAPYHLRVATAYAWLSARESRAPIPVAEIGKRLSAELGQEITDAETIRILKQRPNGLDVVEALARVLHVDPAWLLFGRPDDGARDDS